VRRNPDIDARTQLAHNGPPAITTGNPPSVSDRMCRRSLGCIPGIAPKNLGRSDFAIPLPRLAPERRGRRPFARTSHQRRAQRRTRT